MKKNAILVDALTEATAVRADASLRSGAVKALAVVEAAVEDRQNSRVAPCPVKTRPSAAFPLGTLARL